MRVASIGIAWVLRREKLSALPAYVSVVLSTDRYTVFLFKSGLDLHRRQDNGEVLYRYPEKKIVTTHFPVHRSGRR